MIVLSAVRVAWCGAPAAVSTSRERMLTVSQNRSAEDQVSLCMLFDGTFRHFGHGH
jgi:hypothetical protein